MSLAIAALVAQAGSAVVHLDLARVVMGVAATLFLMLVSIVVYFLKNILAEFRMMRTNVQTVMHVLFGPDGKNGMRSDLRKTRKLQVRHDRLLVALAASAGIDPNLDGDENEEEAS